MVYEVVDRLTGRRMVETVWLDAHAPLRLVETWPARTRHLARVQGVEVQQ